MHPSPKDPENNLVGEIDETEEIHQLTDNSDNGNQHNLTLLYIHIIPWLVDNLVAFHCYDHCNNSLYAFTCPVLCGTDVVNSNI